MRAQISNLVVQQFFDALLGNQAFPSRATVYISGHQINGTEFSGNGYARFAVTNNLTNCPATSGRTKSLAAIANALSATADWGASTDLAFIGIYDASTVGNQLILIPMGGSLQGFTADTSGTITSPAHGYAANQRVQLDTIANLVLPTGLSTLTTYYIVNPTTNAFQLSATAGGAAIVPSAAGAGFIYSYSGRPVYNGDQVSFAAGQISLAMT